jgi:hypothetical protein
MGVVILYVVTGTGAGTCFPQPGTKTIAMRAAPIAKLTFEFRVLIIGPFLSESLIIHTDGGAIVHCSHDM